jgi:DNA-binding NarL/FixJ family response regulator
VVVSDDHPLFARGIAATLRERDDIWVQVSTERPLLISGGLVADVLVAGVDADVRGIWETVDHLMTVLAPAPPPVVLMLPGRSEFEMTAAASLPASAVLARDCSPQALVEAVVTVAEGRTLVASGMAERMLSDFAGMLRRRREAAGIALSDREQQVLDLVAGGLGNRAIAAELHLSEHTVKNHVRRILEKLGAASRTEAVVIAARAGLVAVGQASARPNPSRQ